jgi:hypothetical protein
MTDETKPATTEPAPTARPGSRHVACPSCRAEIEVDPEGNPIADEVAHFDIHKQLLERVEKIEHAAPETPAVQPEVQPEPQPAKRRASWATLQFEE